MRRLMVRYKVRPDRAEENERLVRNVFAELDRSRPSGIRYATFRLDDGATFVHLASVETDDGTNPLLALDAFKTFVETIKERCDDPPITFELEEIGSHRVFAG
ncbi:MAG: hypothetical protein R3E12_13345 [Candidatus Eisenbacteria bacterium]